MVIRLMQQAPWTWPGNWLLPEAVHITAKTPTSNSQTSLAEKKPGAMALAQDNHAHESRLLPWTGC